MDDNMMEMQGDFCLKDHIIICNWSNKAHTIVSQLHEESVKEKAPIIVITNNPEKVPRSIDPAYRGLLMIVGDPAEKEILNRADVQYAKNVIVLADEDDLDNADAKSILIVLAIDAMNPSVHVIVELLKSKNESYFQYTHVNEIICLEQLAEKLLAQSALTPGLSQVYMDLLTQSAATNEIYQVPIPQSIIDKQLTYRDIEKVIITIDEKDIVLIGFSTTATKKVDGKEITNGHGRAITERRVIINPKSSSEDEYSKNHIMQPDDMLFFMSYDRPELGAYF